MSEASTGYDIIAIGEPLYELNQQPDGRYLPGFGGDTSNAIIAASRLGSRTAYVTRLGGDMFGVAFLDLYEQEGVDTSFIIHDTEAPTGLYFVTHSEWGHSFSYRRKDSAASHLRPADIPVSVLSRCAYVHASGITQAISMTAAHAVRHAFLRATKAGCAVSYDTNYRAPLWSAETALGVIEESASRADILKTSTDDAKALLGLDDPGQIAKHFLSLGSKAVVVTRGREGVYVTTGTGQAWISGFPVNAVDATGAGDAFTGALLAECARGADLFAAARFANAAAALSTLDYGAIRPLPRRDAVEAFLRAHS